MKRLWRWFRGYTVEEWLYEERRAEKAVYSRPLSVNQIQAHYLQGAIRVDAHWHYLVMTVERGRRRFYFDGEVWPRE